MRCILERFVRGALIGLLIGMILAGFTGIFFWVYKALEASLGIVPAALFVMMLLFAIIGGAINIQKP